MERRFMTSRSLMVRGPLTDENLAAILYVVRAIEALRPDETFEVYIDAPDIDTEIEKFAEAMNPRRPGYERIVRYRDL